MSVANCDCHSWWGKKRQGGGHERACGARGRGAENTATVGHRKAEQDSDPLVSGAELMVEQWKSGTASGEEAGKIRLGRNCTWMTLAGVHS